MEYRTKLSELVSETAQRLGVELSPQAGQFLTCLVSAILKSMPTIISDVVSCMSSAPPTDDYKPGNRTRC